MTFFIYNSIYNKMYNKYKKPVDFSFDNSDFIQTFVLTKQTANLAKEGKFITYDYDYQHLARVTKSM